MSVRERPRVLWVDGEAQVLEGIALHLRQDYDVYTAASAEQALEQLRRIGAVAVIVADSARESVVHGVNRGGLFRLLTTPCPPNEFYAAIAAGVAQHRLCHTEQVLRDTAIGCVGALIHALAINKPMALDRAIRVRGTRNKPGGALHIACTAKPTTCC
jgi:DNA-binding response OmpR family regulator